MTIPVAYKYPADARYLDLPGVLQGSLPSSVCLVRSGSGSSEAPILDTVQVQPLCIVVGSSQRKTSAKRKRTVSTAIGNAFDWEIVHMAVT